jgi:hypothetical protein
VQSASKNASKRKTSTTNGSDGMRANLVAAIAFAAVAALSTMRSASAVALNPRGLGQVLIFPYYTVNKSQDTLLSIGNAGGTGKVVHVRFRESYNARSVLDFDVFLSPHDVWTAAISQVADDDGARIRTSDASCTNPPIISIGQAFLPFAYAGPTEDPDSGPQSITRTREGFIEVIAVGDATPGSPLDQTITHVQTGEAGGGVPACDPALLQSAAPTLAPAADLFGSVAIVNVGQGTFFGYTPDALTGFTDEALASDAGGPTLDDANTAIASPLTRASVIAGNQPIDVDYELPIDAVSAVFMADSIYNEYFVDPSFGANTDWVVTLPTREFYTDPALAQTVVAPFSELFQNGRSDTFVSGKLYDREEGVFADIDACTLCPPVSDIPSFPYAVNVIDFGTSSTSGVFGSNVVPFFIPPGGATAGNVVLNLVDPAAIQRLTDGIDADGNPLVLLGLPVTGFMAYNVINTNAQPGLLANYSGVFANRATASCSGSSTSCTAIITSPPQ